ncbi:MAG TPA: DEAD/DEAH box helicase [Flavobacterium sp.]|jgi:superfamily II DNA/RNA helicase
MNLKKINPNLAKALCETGLSEANELQQETFSTIKSGADCLIVSPPKSGKTTTIILNVIQQLIAEGEESPRALIMVEDRAKLQEIEDMFRLLNQYNELRVYGVHDKGDIDFDKNHISTGIDVLIGTPNRLNEMFSTAGYNINRLRMLIVDDADNMLKARHESKIMRISNSIAKTQRLIFSDVLTERVELLAEKMLVDPYFFDMQSEEEEQEEN